MRTLFFILCLFGLFSAQISFAQSSITELNEKIRLENEIKQRLNDTLRSRLAAQDYNIEIEVKLMYVAKNILNTNESLNSRTIAKEKMQFIINSSNQGETPYEIEQVNVDLQLSDKIPVEYKNELGAWLDKWTMSYFSNQGKAKVTSLTSKQVSRSKKSDLLEDDFLSIIYKLQNLLGMIFLGSIFVAIWFFSKKQNHEARNEQSTEKSLVVQPSEPEDQPKNIINTPKFHLTHEATPFAGHSIENNVHALQMKISLMAQGMPNQMRSLLSHWLSADSQEYLKTAAFIEAWAIGSSGISQSDKENLFFPIPPNIQVQFQAAVSEFMSLDSTNKSNIYQEIYRALISESFTDRTTSHFQFDFIQNLHDSQYTELFQYLSLEARITFLMKAPRPLIRRLTKIVEADYLVETLKQAPHSKEVSEKVLHESIMTWKQINSLKQNDQLTLTEKISQLQDVWGSLPRKEKALLIEQLSVTNPELKEITQQDQDSHLNSMKQWEHDRLKKFCLKTKTRDLAAAIKTLPFLEQPILSACADIMRSEIQLEVSGLDHKKTELHFKSFLHSYDLFVGNMISQTEKSA